MANSTSGTDVTPLLYAERSGKRSSQSRSEDSKVRSKTKSFDRSGSNSLKRLRGGDNSACERTKSIAKDAKRSKVGYSSSAAEKRSHERRQSNEEDERDLVALSYLNTASNGQSSNAGKKADIESAANRFGESHLKDDDHSEQEEQTTAQIKQCAKRGIRKKMGGDATKKMKSSSSKKDSSWKQNSRSRRLVANARERSRIHILSDAFENLRRAVPSYSHDQKLSKLAILKLATYYISALSNLAESDTSARSLKQFADCVSHCTTALQTEGRSRRKNF